MTTEILWVHPPAWLPEGGGARDFFADKRGTVELLESLVHAEPPSWPRQQAEETALAVPELNWNIIGSVELAGLQLAEPKWAVPGIVPEGVLLMAGKPKFGKSWWVLDLCVAVATGGRAWGRIPVEQGDVLYITYEDTHRRIQDRQQRVLGHERGTPRLDFVTDCPRSDKGGVLLVMQWVKAHPQARLIVIDPLEAWRPEENVKKQLYRQDYDSLRPIVELARNLGISVIVVHHVNKMVNPDYPFDAISGSTGLTGVADAIAVVRMEQPDPDGTNNATLFIRGKDVGKDELVFKDRIDREYPLPVWELTGSGQAYRQSQQRRDVLEALWREPWQTPASIAELMDPPVHKGTMRKRLFDMSRDGLVRVRNGKYAAAVEMDTYLMQHGIDLSNAAHAGNDAHARNVGIDQGRVSPNEIQSQSESGVTTHTDISRSTTDGRHITGPTTGAEQATSGQMAGQQPGAQPGDAPRIRREAAEAVTDGPGEAPSGTSHDQGTGAPLPRASSSSVTRACTDCGQPTANAHQRRCPACTARFRNLGVEELPE